MRITFGTDRSPHLRREFQDWWRGNGLLGTEPVGPVRVDTGRRTITFSQLIDEPLPGDPDFPELRRDSENDPLTQERTVELLVDPPTLLWDRARGSKVA